MPVFDTDDQVPAFDAGRARLRMVAGARFEQTFERVTAQGDPDPFLLGTSARMDVRRFAGGPLLLRFDTEGPQAWGGGATTLAVDGHRITATADALATAGVGEAALFDLFFFPGGAQADAEVLVAGDVLAAEAITEKPDAQ